LNAVWPLKQDYFTLLRQLVILRWVCWYYNVWIWWNHRDTMISVRDGKTGWTVLPPYFDGVGWDFEPVICRVPAPHNPLKNRVVTGRVNASGLRKKLKTTYCYCLIFTFFFGMDLDIESKFCFWIWVFPYGFFVRLIFVGVDINIESKFCLSCWIWDYFI